MHLHRFHIGIRFNKRMFRLPSIGGLLVDDLLTHPAHGKKNGKPLFNRVSAEKNHKGEYVVSLTDENKSNVVSISPEQFDFKRSGNDESSVSIEKTLKELKLLWNVADRVVKFPAIRMIGFVGEFRFEEEAPNNGGKQFMKTLTNFQLPNYCSNFNLNFEYGTSADGSTPDKKKDDFWDTHYSFYLSDRDETPKPGHLNCNLDVQKYFSPAKNNPNEEFATILKRFKSEKDKFINTLKECGLIEK